MIEDIAYMLGKKYYKGLESVSAKCIRELSSDIRIKVRGAFLNNF